MSDLFIHHLPGSRLRQLAARRGAIYNDNDNNNNNNNNDNNDDDDNIDDNIDDNVDKNIDKQNTGLTSPLDVRSRAGTEYNSLSLYIYIYTNTYAAS